MYRKNYLTTIAFTFLIGSTFTPSIGMDIEQQQNPDQFEQAKQLLDYFCITRFSEDNRIPVRKEGEEPNGFELYKKLIQQCSDNTEQAHVRKFAIEKLQNRYIQQNQEFKLSPMSPRTFKQILYFQTLSNRGDYAHNSNEQRELVDEMVDTLVNSEKIERSVAESAVLDRLETFYSNPNLNLPSMGSGPMDFTLSGMNTAVVVQYEDGRGEIINLVNNERLLFEAVDVNFEAGENIDINLEVEDNSLMNRLHNAISNHPFIGIVSGVATIGLSYFLYSRRS